MKHTAISKQALDLTIPIGLLNDLTTSQSRDEIVRIYSQWSKRICNADFSAVALYDGSDHLRVQSVDGRGGVSEGARVPVKGTLLGDAYARQTHKIVRDLASQPYHGSQQLAKSGLDSTIMAPLKTGQHCFGVITAHYRKGRSHTQDEFAVLRSVAGYLATHLLVFEQMDNLAELANTDPLTTARNRRYYAEQAPTYWENWITRAEPFTFAALDLDHFKHINDTHGHDAGDQVLRVVVSRLKNQLRGSDCIVRMGGEEFCVILPNIANAVALKIVQRLFQCIRADPISWDGHQIAITASIGIAAAHQNDTDHNAVLKRADEAVYAAKAAGRDQVAVSNSDQSISVSGG